MEKIRTYLDLEYLETIMWFQKNMKAPKKPKNRKCKQCEDKLFSFTNHWYCHDCRRKFFGYTEEAIIHGL